MTNPDPQNQQGQDPRANPAGGQPGYPPTGGQPYPGQQYPGGQYPQQGQYPPGQYPAGQYGQQPMGPYGYGMPYGPPPENNLVWGIVVTVVCCLPLGIVSIVKANQVNTLWAQGLHDAARQSAAEAKSWAKWGAIVAGIGLALYLIVIIIAVVVTGAAISEITPVSYDTPV